MFVSCRPHTCPSLYLPVNWQRKVYLPGQPPNSPQGLPHTDQTQLLEPVLIGPPGSRAAVRICLGWTLQGPSKHLQDELSAPQCLFTSSYHRYVLPSREAVAFGPFWNEKVVRRSKQDHSSEKRICPGNTHPRKHWCHTSEAQNVSLPRTLHWPSRTDRRLRNWKELAMPVNSPPKKSCSQANCGM